MKLEQMTLCFEDGDFVEIPAIYTHCLVISEIKKELVGDWYQGILEMDIAHSFCVEIDAGANVPRENDCSTTVFDRLLNHRDIDSVILTCEESVDENTVKYKKYRYSLPWGISDLNYNSFEKTFYTHNGNLLIAIHETKDIKDYFSDEIMDYIERYPR